jgi:hypothetical protein
MQAACFRWKKMRLQLLVLVLAHAAARRQAEAPLPIPVQTASPTVPRSALTSISHISDLYTINTSTNHATPFKLPLQKSKQSSHFRLSQHQISKVPFFFHDATSKRSRDIRKRFLIGPQGITAHSPPQPSARDLICIKTSPFAQLLLSPESSLVNS